MKCNNCGAPLQLDQKFCPNCGQAIDWSVEHDTEMD